MIRTLIAILLVLGLFEPLGVLLRGQNPWNCFQATYDENVFAEAISNQLEGKGFRLTADPKPYNPLITVGPPLTLSTRMGALVSGGSLVQEARAGVYLCFLLLLGLLAWEAFSRSRKWGSSLIAVALFTYWHSRTTAGPYLTYGVLGEVPGLLIATAALLALDRKRYWLSGLVASSAFFAKPTFLFLIPAVTLCAPGLKAKTKTALASALGCLAVLMWIAHARGEGLLEYWSVFSQSARQITADASHSSVWHALRDGSAWGWTLLLIAGLACLTGKRPANRAALLFFMLGVIYFWSSGKPMPKHAWVFSAPLMGMGALAISESLGRLTSQLLGEERLRAVLLTITVVWLMWIPGGLKRTFQNIPIEGCPVKEQREISLRVSSQAQAQDPVLLWVPSTGDGRWLKLTDRVPREVATSEELMAQKSSASLGASIWIAGPASTSPPQACKAEWVGKHYGFWRCQN